MYRFLVDDSSEHKKAKCLNRNVVEKITNNEYEDVPLNQKCLWHSMNRIQVEKNQRIGTYEINKITLSCFDDKTYIQSNEYDGLVLGYQI